MSAAAVAVRAFRRHPSALAGVREFVRERAAEAGFDEREAEELVLAVSEACTNSVVHTESPDMRVTWTLDGDCAEIRVSDRGRFRQRVRMPELEGVVAGHGIPLMSVLTDRLHIEKGSPRGTIVVLVKCLGADRSESFG